MSGAGSHPARAGAGSDRCPRSRRHDAPGLLAAALAGGTGEPRAASALALRRRLPRARVLGRPGRRRGSARRPASSPTAEDPGRAAALFVDWQSCTDSRDELLDPARSQYKEFFIVVNAVLDGEHVTTCPYIWVDRDFALVRGWIQGFPKKLGSVWMTRTLRARLPRRPRPARRRGLRRNARGERPAPRAGNRDARARLRVGPDAQRPAARQRAPLPAARRGTARRPGRARARPGAQPRPLDLRDLGGARRPSSSSRRRTRSTRRSRPYGWARASGSRSPTRSTTSRP